MPVSVPPLEDLTKNIELKESYIDKEGNIVNKITKVILPTFNDNVEDNNSFNIETE